MQLIICVSDSHSLGQVPRFKPEDGDDYCGDDDDDDDGGDGDGDGDDGWWASVVDRPSIGVRGSRDSFPRESQPLIRSKPVTI